MLFSVLNLSANATPQFLDDRKIVGLIYSPVSPPKTLEFEFIYIP
jgi:hypothetical protein